MNISKHRVFFVSLALFLLFVVSVPGFEPAETTEARILKMMDTASIPGMSAAVMKDGKLLWSRGFGIANLEHDLPVTTKTRFRLASVSKVVTAAAVARLVDSGKLDLDAPISKYVEDLPENLGAVTSRQLAGHLAGVRHYQTKDFVPSSIDNQNFPTVLSSLSIFKDDPLLSAPGAEYQYTTFGFTLLAAVIERASGRPFLEYLDGEVFKPLNLNSAGPDSPFLITPNRTSFYMAGPQNSILNATFVNPSYKWAGGGLLMTAEDLSHFGDAHLKSGFIKDSMLKTMFTSQKTNDGKETGVGITWRIATGYFGNTIYHHEGSMHGSRSALLIYPEIGLSVAFVTNMSGTPRFGFETAQLIAEPFLDKKPGIAFDPTGDFKVTGKALGKDMTGTLKVSKTKTGFGGSFDFGQERLEVVGAIPHKNGHFLVVAHRSGGLDLVPVFEDSEANKAFNFAFNFERL